MWVSGSSEDALLLVEENLLCKGVFKGQFGGFVFYFFLVWQSLQIIVCSRMKGIGSSLPGTQITHTDWVFASDSYLAIHHFCS